MKKLTIHSEPSDGRRHSPNWLSGWGQGPNQTECPLAYKQQTLVAHGLEAEKSKIKAPMDSLSNEVCFLAHH